LDESGSRQSIAQSRRWWDGGQARSNHFGQLLTRRFGGPFQRIAKSQRIRRTVALDHNAA
jgi:hypothetical protein